MTRAILSTGANAWIPMHSGTTSVPIASEGRLIRW